MCQQTINKKMNFKEECHLQQHKKTTKHPGIKAMKYAKVLHTEKPQNEI